MKLTILGSGTGTPMLERAAAGIMLQIKGNNLLFDSGPGTLKKLLELGITYHDIDYIFYTHFHTDHTLDLAAILFAARYPLSLRTKKLRIIGAHGLKQFYENLLALYGNVITPEAYELELREIGECTLEEGPFTIKTLSMSHTPQSLGFRVEADGKVFVYSGDTDFCENILTLGEKADILILECSFPNEMKVKGHLIPEEAGRIAAECNCKKLVLSHLYPICQADELIRQTKNVFRAGVVVAQDLMSFAL